MLLLAIDTATAQVSVAFGDRRRGARARCSSPAAAVTPSSSRPRSTTCAVSSASTSTTSPRSRSAPVPGLFTGLRVGVTTAKVMAQALRIPVVGVPSLDLVAYPLRHSRPHDRRGARRPPPRGVRGAVPAGARRRAAGRPTTRCTRPPSWSPTSRPTRPSPHGLLLAGDGVARFPDEFAALEHAELAGTEFAAPSVAALVALATARAEREEFELPADAAPALPPPERRRDRLGRPGGGVVSRG